MKGTQWFVDQFGFRFKILKREEQVLEIEDEWGNPRLVSQLLWDQHVREGKLKEETHE